MDLHQSILQTLAYFDIFGQPLTKEELFRYLLIYRYPDLRITYTDFLNQLEQLQELNQFQHQDGFYFLRGRENIVAIRQSKVKIIEEKFKIARRGIKKISKVPFVRAVFLCNTVAFGTADKDSDIDVLIVVKKGRIWLARLLSAMVLSLFGLRRTKNRIKNKICLSFYLADDNLNLEKISIENDIYLAYWLAQLVPIYDPEGLHQSVVKANKWAEKYLANGISGYGMLNIEYRNSKLKKFLEKMWNREYGNMLENQAKAIQQVKMKMNTLSAQNAPGTRVVVSDSMLKFHERDRREEYKNLWLEKCKNFIA